MSKRNKKLLVYSLILILPFTFLFLSQSFFTPLKMQIVENSSLPLRIVLFPFQEIKKIITYRRTYRTYMQLKEEVETLRSRLVGQEEVLKENSRLKKLLDIKKDSIFSSVAANIIGRDPSNWNAAVIIDKGHKDGLKEGLPVINALGVVGKIAEVGAHTSKVVLISDPNFSVAALIQRTREVGLISGTLQGVCRMRYLPAESKVRVGDKVVSSKVSSSFPEGFLIGEVISVQESQSSPTLECLVQPIVELSQLEEVLIIY